jgi:DNA-binding transcriptional LysR family regulator
MHAHPTNVFDRWSRVQLQHLATFVAIAKDGSVARAADRLGYTQPAISHQLATLERILGTRLFDRRSGRGDASLTEAGRLFAGHVRGVEAVLSAGEADLAAFAAGSSARIRIGAFQSVSARILPPLLQRLTASEPRVRLELTERTEEADILDALVTGAIDYAFLLLPVDDNEVESIELIPDPFFLVAPAAAPLHLERLSDVGARPIVAPRTCRSWTMVEAQLVAAGVTPNYIFRTDDNLAIRSLVRNGVGVAFLSRLALDEVQDGLAISPVDGLLAPRRIALAWSRHRAAIPEHDRLVDEVRAVCSAALQK